MLQGRFTPLYHRDILAEYNEVFRRSRFHPSEKVIQAVMSAIQQFGIEVFPQPTGEILVGLDDLIFHEVVLEKREDSADLVAGNQKQHPIRDFIISPAEMMAMSDGKESQ